MTSRPVPPWAVFLLAGYSTLLVLVVMSWRLATIDQRVFHGDEAVQAMRTAWLMMEGTHPFDPADHHGPLLHYLSAALHLLSGIRTSGEMSSISVRILPFLSSLFLLAMTLLLRPVAGVSALALAPLLVLSPCFFYYSSYYIQEPLLAALSLLAVTLAVRILAEKQNRFEAFILAGALGLTMALKVSAILLIASIAAGLFAAGWRRAPSRGEVLLLAACFLAPIVLFYSAFLMKPAGLLQFSASLFDGSVRAATGAKHQHGPGFFINRLVWYRSAPGPSWSEWPVLLLAIGSIVGLLTRWRKSLPWQRFLATQPLVLLLFYMIIPYKTPWLLLSPLVLLAASSVILPTMLPGRWKIIALVAMLLIPLAQVPTLKDTAGRFSADPRNPWVYSHSVSTVEESAQKIATMLRVARNKDGIMAVLGHDYWPYPWYLRQFDNIGYWPTLPDHPVQILLVPHDELDAVRARLDGEYMEEYLPMRPEVPIVLMVERDLWRTWLMEYRQ